MSLIFAYKFPTIYTQSKLLTLYLIYQIAWFGHKIFFGTLKINVWLSTVVFAQNFHSGLVLGYMLLSNEKKKGNAQTES